jgi:hypothetical protein
MSVGGGGEGASFVAGFGSSFTEADCFRSLDFTVAGCVVVNSTSGSLGLSFSLSMEVEASDRGAMLSPPSSSVVDGAGHAGPLGLRAHATSAMVTSKPRHRPNAITRARIERGS